MILKTPHNLNCPELDDEGRKRSDDRKENEMKKIMFLTASTIAMAKIARPVAFDPGKNGWKVDDDGKLVVDDKGNPVYIGSDGKEQSVQGDTISRLNGEAKTHREAKEKAEADLAKYADIDPVKAKEALETIAKLDAKQLIDAGEVDKVRDEISKGFTAQIAEKDKAIEGLTGDLNGLKLETAFANSGFLQDRVGIPAEAFKAVFAKNFKVEDGKPVPYGPDGNKVYSKKNMGEIAGFDEALEILVGQSPNKDAYLKADGGSGSGSSGGGGGRGTGRRIMRSEFEKMSPAQQAEAAQLQAKGEVTISD